MHKKHLSKLAEAIDALAKATLVIGESRGNGYF